MAPKKPTSPDAGPPALDSFDPPPAEGPVAPTPPRAAKLPTQNGPEMSDLFGNYTDRS